MTKAESRKIIPGLYFIFWKSGGRSLASVGLLHNGDRWFAAHNWTGESTSKIASTSWRDVDCVWMIENGTSHAR